MDEHSEGVQNLKTNVEETDDGLLKADAIGEDEKMGMDVPQKRKREHPGEAEVPELEEEAAVEENTKGAVEEEVAATPKKVRAAADGGINFVLVIEKILTRSDVTRYKLSLPRGKLRTHTFLQSDQSELLDQNKSVRVYLRDVNGLRIEVVMKAEKEGKDSEEYTKFFRWKPFVKSNKFEAGQTIQVWKFEADGTYEFLVRRI